MSTAIRVEQLGKRYRIGQRERYLTLRDTLAELPNAAARLFSRRLGDARNSLPQHIWALRNASFQVQEAEVVGIIGRNGAGKTTLLKILARITQPTEGYAEIHGRVGSLLEVGTGFHPELSGRENVYLSGAILGMSKKEIDRRFDEIVGFAGLEIFMDTPLKHYSAGMHMRLAFAVAAHLEPDILLVDEVLAVGDLEFQKKCLGKMSEVARGGRTVFFVSHQMNQIRRLCERVLWLDAGQLRQEGAAGAVVNAYEESVSVPADRPTEGLNIASEFRFLAWEVVEPRGYSSNIVAGGSGKVVLKAVVWTPEPIRRGLAGAYIYDADGRLLWGWAQDGFEMETGTYELYYAFPYLPLRPGPYQLHLCMYDDKQLKEYWPAVPALVIEDQPRVHFMDEWSGVLNLPCRIEFKLAGSDPKVMKGAG